jgi:hypothetical protein
VILWAISALGMKDLSKEHVMKAVERQLQQQCGIHSIHYEGRHGHIFYTNDVTAIIAQVGLYKI